MPFLSIPEHQYILDEKRKLIGNYLGSKYKKYFSHICNIALGHHTDQGHSDLDKTIWPWVVSVIHVIHVITCMVIEQPPC